MDNSRERGLIWAIIASQFAPPFMFSGVAVALPAIGTDLQAGATSLNLIETLFLAGSAATLLPIGRLADATDRRTLYKLGLLSFGLLSVLIGLLSNVDAICFVRLLQGGTSALLAATGPAILAELVPPERRGRVYGASLGAIYGGLTLGPVAGGMIVATLGWRGVFLGGALPLLAGAAFIHRRMQSGWKHPQGSVDLPSSAWSILAVLSLVAAAATGDNQRVSHAALAAAVLLGGLFLARQTRIHNPLIDVRKLLAHRVLSSALTVQFLVYLTAYASTFMLSLFLQINLHEPPTTSGPMLALGSVLMAVAAPFSGRLADRLDPHRLTAFGVASVLAAAALGRQLDASSTPASVAIIILLQGAGFALFSSPNMSIIMNSVDKQELGMASALAAAARSFGMVFGMLVTALLVAREVGQAPISEHPEALVSVVRTTYSVLVVANTLALLLALIRRRSARGDGGPG